MNVLRRVSTVIGHTPGAFDLVRTNAFSTQPGALGIFILQGEVLVQAQIAVVDELWRTARSIWRGVGLTVLVELHRHVLRKRNEFRCFVVVQRNVLLGEGDVAAIVNGHPLSEPNANATTAHQHGRDLNVKVCIDVVEHTAFVHHERWVVDHVQRGILTSHRIKRDIRSLPNRGFRVHKDDKLIFLGHIATSICGDVRAVEDRTTWQVETSCLIRRTVHPNHFHNATPIERTVVVD